MFSLTGRYLVKKRDRCLEKIINFHDRHLLSELYNHVHGQVSMLAPGINPLSILDNIPCHGNRHAPNMPQGKERDLTSHYPIVPNILACEHRRYGEDHGSSDLSWRGQYLLSRGSPGTLTKRICSPVCGLPLRR